MSFGFVHFLLAKFVFALFCFVFFVCAKTFFSLRKVLHTERIESEFPAVLRLDARFQIAVELSAVELSSTFFLAYKNDKDLAHKPKEKPPLKSYSIV